MLTNIVLIISVAVCFFLLGFLIKSKKSYNNGYSQGQEDGFEEGRKQGTQDGEVKGNKAAFLSIKKYVEERLNNVY